MHIRQFQRLAALVVGALLAAFGAQAAGDFTVQNGNWVVTSELNGEPGRGMAIDVQDGTLVMQVYNYEASGQPTFHMSFGAMDGNHYRGALHRYKNGRYYGSDPRSATEDGSAGDVQVDFESATTGTIQFPGEEALAISRYKFDDVPNHLLSRPGAGERWLMAEIDENDTPIGALLVNVFSYDGSPEHTMLGSVRSRLDGDSSAPADCSYSASTQRFSCAISFTGTNAPRTLQWSKHLEGMSGRISVTGGCTFSPCPPTATTWRRVVGMRLGLDFSVAAVNAQMDTLAADMPASSYHPAPDPGNWIISSELDGNPGRGMAIDVQYDTLVMQVYNYETSGAPTFHMAVAPYQQAGATGSLIRYEGGRYFGSPALIGHAAGDAGEVQLEFATPTRGTIQFPGEAPVAMQRYQFGATAPQVESLFGHWMFFEPESRSLNYIRPRWVSSSDPAVATGDSFDTCRYTSGADEAVRCNSDSAVNHDEFRFTPVNGRAIGTMSYTHSSDPKPRPVYVLRIKDRHGTLAGLGKF